MGQPQSEQGSKNVSFGCHTVLGYKIILPKSSKNSAYVLQLRHLNGKTRTPIVVKMKPNDQEIYLYKATRGDTVIVSIMSWSHTGFRNPTKRQDFLLSKLPFSCPTGP